jgi:signal peptidase II
MKRYLLLVIGGIVGVALDQITKIWAARSLMPSGLPSDASQIRSETYVVVENFFNFRLAGNKGAAWGMFRDLPESYRVGFFALIAVVAIFFIIKLYRDADEQPVMRWALTFIVAGAVGNLIDRLRLGYVIDFIDWYKGASHWPTFNVADVWISMGVGLMFIDIFVQYRKGKRARETQEMLE